MFAFVVCVLVVLMVIELTAVSGLLGSRVDTAVVPILDVIGMAVDAFVLTVVEIVLVVDVFVLVADAFVLVVDAFVLVATEWRMTGEGLKIETVVAGDKNGVVLAEDKTAKIVVVVAVGLFAVVVVFVVVVVVVFVVVVVLNKDWKYFVEQGRVLYLVIVLFLWVLKLWSTGKLVQEEQAEVVMMKGLVWV